MNCPICGTALGPLVVGHLTICPNPACLRSLVVEGDTVRTAMGADTVPLDAAGLTALRQQRKVYREA